MSCFQAASVSTMTPSLELMSVIMKLASFLSVLELIWDSSSLLLLCLM